MSLAIYHHNNLYETFVSTFLLGISQDYVSRYPRTANHGGLFYIDCLMSPIDVNASVGSLNKKK